MECRFSLCRMKVENYSLFQVLMVTVNMRKTRMILESLKQQFERAQFRKVLFENVHRDITSLLSDYFEGKTVKIVRFCSTGSEAIDL